MILPLTSSQADKLNQKWPKRCDNQCPRYLHILPSFPFTSTSTRPRYSKFHNILVINIRIGSGCGRTLQMEVQKRWRDLEEDPKEEALEWSGINSDQNGMLQKWSRVILRFRIINNKKVRYSICL